MKKKKRSETNNVIVVSDIHAGCQLALCPPGGVRLDNDGRYMPSRFQRKLWSMWKEFWDIWVPMATRGEPYDVVINGDVVDGVHHGSTTQISHNLEDQARIAMEILEPIVAGARRFFMIRGTEAHVGQSGQEEEKLAQRLGAVPNEQGQYARHELWMRVGPALAHIMHHIGTTSSASYESTAVHKELVESYTEAARHRDEPPDIIVRSHRHRYFRTSCSGAQGEAISVVSPGWQGKTPFSYKIAGGRLSLPQFGGLLLRSGDEDAIYVRHKTFFIERSAVV